MIRVECEPSKELVERAMTAVRDRRIGVRPASGDENNWVKAHLRKPQVAMELALYGRSVLFGDLEATLGDVEVTSMGFVGGDDPALSRDANQANLRKCIVNGNDYLLFAENETEMLKNNAHFADLLVLFDEVAGNAGTKRTSIHEEVPKTTDFSHAESIVVGDTLRWKEKWFRHMHVNGKRNQDFTFVGNVVYEHFGADGSRVLDLEVVRGFGDNVSLPGETQSMSERQLLDELKSQRKIWVNETERDVRVNKSTEQRSSMAHIARVRAENAAKDEGNETGRDVRTDKSTPQRGSTARVRAENSGKNEGLAL